MNRGKNEWWDYTWNPVTGCWGPGGTPEKPNRCFDGKCYALRMSNRTEHHLPRDERFRPTFHLDRLWKPSKLKKPSRIFVCSMADLFGDWVPFLWILEVLRACEKAPWHTYLFLTKNPHRYVSIQRVESRYRKLWPDNCWLGVTVTNQEDADKRIPELWEADCRTIFVSAEPVLGPIHLPRPPDYSPGDPSLGLSWLIIGAMTGPKAIRPKVDWVNSLVIQAKSAGIPIFVKNNLNVLCYGHFMTHRDFPG